MITSDEMACAVAYHVVRLGKWQERVERGIFSIEDREELEYCLQLLTNIKRRKFRGEDSLRNYKEAVTVTARRESSNG